MPEVIGSYQLDRVLGEGGMGVVYLAEHTLLHRRVAIKLLSKHASRAVPNAAQRFVNEAQATSAIEDPGIVQIFDFGYHTDGRAYIVMEYLDGERLDHRVLRTRKLSVAQALRLGRQLASSLQSAHCHGVLHRDLKPDNILLVPDPAVSGGLRAKLLDFGICKRMNATSARTTIDGLVVGTPTYMSPEQCRGRDDLDERSDVYSLGCVLHFMLTGQPVFLYRSTCDLLAAHLKEKPGRASALNPDVPRQLDDLLARCLAKDVKKRFASMAELGDELSELLRIHADDITDLVEGGDYPRGTPNKTTLMFDVDPPLAARTPGDRFLAWGRRAILLAFAALTLSAAAGSGCACVSNGGGVRTCTTSDAFACL